jgi:hypothetical protein
MHGVRLLFFAVLGKKMKNKLETALLINRVRDAGGAADRLYFGNEFCENLIPSVQALKKMHRAAEARHRGFTFVTPFVTNAGLQRLEGLLSYLDRRQGIEVVFNDWGVLKLLRDRFRNLEPVLGRLLTKQRRDPRMMRIFTSPQKFRESISPDGKVKTVLIAKKTPHSMFEHYQSSVINLPAFQEYLISQGIFRVEIDNLVWPMKIEMNRKIGVSVYLPYGYITTTRMCGKWTLSYAACKKECRKFFIRLNDASFPVPFYGIGNTIFYESKPPSYDYLRQLGVDRIVYQPRLPF